MFDGIIGRTPIYDQSLELFGYDLQFGCQKIEGTGDVDGGDALEDCVSSAVREIPLEKIAGRKIGFIEAPQSILTDPIDLSWPKEQVIFRMSDNLLTVQHSIAKAKELASQGFIFDLEARSYRSVKAQTLDLVAICSVDADTLTEGLEDQIPVLQKRGIRLLARNIQTPDQYSLVNGYGFDYYQGAYFEQPKPFEGTEIPANRLAVMHLLARLQDPDIEIGEVEDLICRDVTLSYKLLRLINSAFFGVPKSVESISRAVVLYGLQRIKSWATVILVNGIDYKPRELLVTALVRAKTCELLAEAMGRKEAGRYYIAGLFSVLDAMMNVPMSRLVERLNLIDDISNALVDKTGPIGDLLATVIAFERGLNPEISALQLEPGEVINICLEAIDWTNQVSREMLGG